MFFLIGQERTLKSDFSERIRSFQSSTPDTGTSSSAPSSKANRARPTTADISGAATFLEFVPANLGVALRTAVASNAALKATSIPASWLPPPVRSTVAGIFSHLPPSSSSLRNSFAISRTRQSIISESTLRENGRGSGLPICRTCIVSSSETFVGSAWPCVSLTFSASSFESFISCAISLVMCCAETLIDASEKQAPLAKRAASVVPPQKETLCSC